VASFRNEEAVHALLWAAKDSDPSVSRTALDALSTIPLPEAVNCLIELTANPALRENAIAAIAEVKEDQVDWVARGLRHPLPETRTAVVEALARMKTFRATEKIVQALNDEHATVRWTAISKITQLGSCLGERELREMARSDSDMTVRRAAMDALKLECQQRP
jgi:HEAT repeat protein